jgi:hypothetical protein
MKIKLKIISAWELYPASGLVESIYVSITSFSDDNMIMMMMIVSKIVD